MQQVLKRMQRSKIFVHPSAYEGFGVVCLEALYAGAQVVSFVKPMKSRYKKLAFCQGRDQIWWDLVRELLNNPDHDDTPVAPFLIKDSAVAMMKLFDYNEATTS